MEKATKLLGGWGYIGLIVGSVLGHFGIILNLLALAGLICVLIAFFRASKELSQPKIQSNITAAVILYIVAYLLLIFLVGAAVLSLMHGSGTGMAAFGGGALISGLIAWILWIVGAWFWYQASVPMADATGVSLYKTGGLLIFIGAITVIIFIGVIIMLIGWIMQTVAFFTTTQKTTASSPA